MRPEERKALLDVVGRAFFDDPVATYLFPDDAVRRRRYSRFAGLAIDSFGGQGRVLTTHGIQGAALWQRPDPNKIGAFAQLRLMASLVRIARSGLGRALRLGAMMTEHHLKTPHWYLAVLATDPSAQRHGIGSALMQPVLDECDKTGVPAYLESSKEANIAFYNKHGFEVIEALETPDGPTLWPMVREPA
jgi:ribosomal protein S18 acetylase RimI-like enzyme